MMGRLTLLLAALLALAPVPAVAVGASGPAPLHGVIAGEPMWEDYRARFIRPEGRVVDTANGSITHSEGQGYAMLLALAADDPATFARLWSFTRTHMALRADGLIAWRWEEGRGVTDPNNATDGDLLIAWALHEAHAVGWGVRYGEAADGLVAALPSVMPTHAGAPVIAPGAAGFPAKGGGRMVNPSYWVFPALERLSGRDPALAAVAASGRALIERAASNGVPTDWMRLDAEGLPHPATDPSGAAPAMAYNAVRLPLHLAWDDARGLPALRAVLGRWPDGAVTTVPADGTPGEPMGGAGYRAVAALGACALHRTPLPDDLRSGLDEHYYPASLHLLSIVALKGEYPQCW